MKAKKRKRIKTSKKNNTHNNTTRRSNMEAASCTINLPFLNICVTNTQLLIGALVIVGAFMLISYINGASTRRQIKQFDKMRDRVKKEKQTKEVKQANK